MTIIDNNWDFRVDIHGSEKESYSRFQEKVSNSTEQLVKIINVGFQSNQPNRKPNQKFNCDVDLQSLIEKNKQLKSDIDSKLQELTKNQEQYEGYKKDRKLLSQEIKETHEAFLSAKKYYKKFLKIYYTIESTADNKQSVFVQFFTESKKETDNYSVRLIRDSKTGHYELTDMTPKVKSFSEVQKKLLDTNDLPGALCHMRQLFLKMKQSK
ncbi:uncharacterized protein LOC105392441 [Plutella xylostella]|uniref:uncharacterized protein LOC105392441 n=1 Tax=Plutella xylostella TaxID=51655 RepID=UPI0020329EAC|nr:uncharacterized protein LOC105392441 [Plutella xylostella]